MAPYAVPWVLKRFRRRHAMSIRIKTLIFCLNWSAVVFGVFSAIPTKLPPYVLPGVPTMCLAVGIFLHVAEKTRSKLPRIPFAATTLGWYALVVVLVPFALLNYYKYKHADFRDLVLGAANGNLATFWRDSPAGVFYHRKKVPLVMTVQDLDRFMQSGEKPHLIIVTRDLIPFLKLEAKNSNITPICDKGNFALYNLDVCHRSFAGKE